MDFQLIKYQRLLLLKDETDSGVLFQFLEAGNQGPQEHAVQVRTPLSVEIDSYDGRGVGGVVLRASIKNCFTDHSASFLPS